MTSKRMISLTGLAFLALFLVSTLQQCTTGSNGCQTCNAGLTACQTCFAGFYLSGGTCSACNSRCATCNGAGFNSCQTCTPGHFHNGATRCNVCNARCSTCTAAGFNSCPSCNAGFFLSGATTCLPCSAACVTCVSTATTCISCASGSYLPTGSTTCSTCSSPCSTCQLSANNCLSCLAGFYFIASVNNCLPCTSPCASCSSSATTCTSCISGFTLDATTSTCKGCTIPGCSACNPTTNACTTCLDGFGLLPTACTACTDTNCKTCPATAGTCTACKDGFFNTAGCTACDPSCATCSAAGTTSCTSCSSGKFRDNSGSCVNCNAICLTCAGGAGPNTCTSCAAGSFLNGNTCTACAANCVTCTSATVCQTCLAGFYLSSVNSCLACPTGCTKCTSLSVCSECAVNYGFNSGSVCRPCQTYYTSPAGTNVCVCATPTTSPPGHPCRGILSLPCIQINPSGECLKCISPYELINKRCILPTAQVLCAPRQYLSFGVCTNVSPLCATFDSVTGNCLSCTDPVNYDLMAGICVRKIVICGPRQYVKDSKCVDVSSLCDTFDRQTGKCLTCLNPTLFNLVNGECIRIVINCAFRQFQEGLRCVDFPVQCLDFDPVTKQCRACISRRYVLANGGLCRLINCPNRFYFDEIAGACVQVSQLCGLYDPNSGACLTCQSINFIVQNGNCVRAISALAGCRAKTNLGFNPCSVANCLFQNLNTGNCVQCQPRFILVNNQCLPEPACDLTLNYIRQGLCIRKPDNCAIVNQFGQCQACTSGRFVIRAGFCVQLIPCPAGTYLSSPNVCTNANPGCVTNFNPSNGQCITCDIPGTVPNLGFCCPVGQKYSNGQCQVIVNNGDSVQNIQSNCLRFNLNQCVRCKEGFRLDLLTRRFCIPS